MNVDTAIVQYEFDGSAYERWQFTLDTISGYYSIKSLGSSSSYYMTVEDNASTLNQDIVLGTTSTVNGAKWRVSRSTSGAYIITPKTGENAGGSGVNYVLATSTSETDNNKELIQGKYKNNTSYRDEWFLVDVNRIYGSKPFRELSSGLYVEMNCHGYAMFRDDIPAGWTTTVNAYLSTVSSTLSFGNNDYPESVKQNVSQKTKEDFERWLDNNGYNYIYESDFANNGQNRILETNQYRVVLRTGLHNVPIGAGGQKKYDYHFWYQTYDGTWANKHGAEWFSSPEHLPVGITPFSQSTSGWNLNCVNQLTGEVVFTYNNFYDGDIYVYIIIE